MRPPRTTRNRRGALTLGAALALAGVPAAAQETAPEPRSAEAAGAPAAGEPTAEKPPATPAPPAPKPSDIEVITIRGRHHDDLLQDTAVSATTFDAKELDDLRIQNIADLGEYTPNLDIKTRSAASNPNLFIRGIGLKDYNANAAGAVAIYQDGININAPAIQLFQLFDVESIEVLRGPQGSGSGRNATAGAIKINSVKPDGLFGGNASFTYGNYNTIEAEGAISLPLIDEVLSSRFAFTASFADGNTDNECADWNPESVGSPVLSEASIRQAWADELRLYGERRRFRNQAFFPILGNSPETDALGRPLVPDDVCITDPAGRLEVGPLTNRLPVPIWHPPSDPAIRTVEDFQGLDERVNDVNNWAARGLFRFQPFADMDWMLNAHGGQNRSGSRHLQMLASEFFVVQNALAEDDDIWSEANAALSSGREGVRRVPGFGGPASSPAAIVGEGRGGADPFSGWYDSEGDENLDSWGVSLRGTWDLGRTVVTSLSGYEWYDRLVEDEGDASPRRIFPAEYSDSAWQVSQELKLEGEGERYRWSLGGLFLQEKLDAFNLFPGVFGFRIDQTFSQELWSVGPYVVGRYELTEELGLEAGVRYNVEHKEFTLESTSIAVVSGQMRPEIPEQTQDDTWKAVTGDVTLSYTPFWSVLDLIQNDSLNLYLKYTHGMKPGHFNASISIQQSSTQDVTINPVEPEFIDAAEVGWKSSWFDDRLSVNVAGFRYWYKDLQVFEINNGAGELALPELLNGDARVWGAEVELQARPIPGLLIQSAFGWLDSTFSKFTVNKTVSRRMNGDPNVQPFDYAGNPLISAPRYDVSTIVEYEIPLWGLGSLVPQYDFSWRSKTYFDPAAIDPISEEPYWLHNARLAYRTPDGRIEVAGWVQNFTNTFYKTDAFDLSLGFDSILEVWGDPRTYGLTVTYTW